MGITRYPKFALRLTSKLFRCDKVEMLMAGGMAMSAKMQAKWENKAYKLGQKVARK